MCSNILETAPTSDERLAALEAENAALRRQLEQQQQQTAMLHQTLAELRSSEEHYRTMALFTTNWEYWVAPAGNHIFVSPACERITGYPPEAFMRDPNFLLAITHPDDRSNLRCHLDAPSDCRHMCETEFRIRTRDGDECWIWHTCEPVYDSTGRFRGRCSSNQDITRHKRAESALRKSQSLLYSLLNNASSVIMVKDQHGRIVLANRAAEALFAAEPGELMGKTNADLFSHREAQHVEALEQRVSATHTPETQEETIDSIDGLHTLLMTIFPICDESEQPDLIGIIATDISERSHIEEALREAHAELEQRVRERTSQLFATIETLHREIGERMQTEEALRQSEARYREVTDLISDSVYSVCYNPDGTYELEWGYNGIERLTGYTSEEVPPQNWLSILHPDDQPIVALRQQRLMNGYPTETDYRLLRKDGGMVWVRDYGRPVWSDEAQRVVRLYGAIRDVTMYKEASRALYESERRLATLMDNLPGMAYRCHNDYQFTMEFVNQGSKDLTGYHPTDLINNASIAFGDLIHPDDHQRVWEETQASVQARRPFNYQYRLRCAGGVQKWVWEQGVGVFDDNGTLLLLEGFITDITDKIRTQEAVVQAENFKRAILDSLTDHIAVLDVSGTIIAVNQAWVAFAEANPAARSTIIEGANYYQVCEQAHGMNRTDAQRFTVGIRLVISGQRDHVAMEYPCYLPDQQRWFIARVTRFAENGPAYVVVAHQDISERKQAEDRIQQHAARAEALRRIAESLNARLDLATILNEVCVKTAQALQVDIVTIFLYNPQSSTMEFAAHLGFPPDVVLRIRPIPLAAIDTTRTVRVVDDTFREPSVHPESRRLIEAHGMRSMLRAMVLREKEIIGIIMAFTTSTPHTFTREEQMLIRGIADQAALAIANARLFDEVQQERALLSRRVEERTTDLRRSNAELAHAVCAKDEFLANMSHELRTPLNAILGLSESLQEQVYGPLTERQCRALVSIEQSGRHLLSLINDILDLAKIESGTIELALETIDIQTVCQASLQFIKQQAHKKQITVMLHIDAALPATMQADMRRLKQILINLLTNAVKFTPAGGKVGLDVRPDAATPQIHFAVWDTGIGISPQDQQRLFQPFIQVDSSLAREHEGTGLGLALVMRLTRLHGGSVVLESEAGQGSRFTVSLPLAQHPPASSHHAAPTAPANGHAPTAPDDRSGAPAAPLILLAEDNETSIETITDYLEAKGYRTIVARNGSEAVEAVSAQRPDLILMDIQMPHMDGLEAIRRIRAAEAASSNAHIPIVALTALAMKGDRERCLEAGASDYLSKPVRLSALAHTIAACLEEHTG